jgi:hypothetical protein
LETQTTGADSFAAVNNYFQEKGLLWINCISVCSDGAAAMTGYSKESQASHKKKTPL